MYDIYISKFKDSNGNTINDEQLMFSIPDVGGDFPVQKPMVKSSEDAADNFSFSMESNSPYYDSLLPLKTMLRVVYDGTNIFYGKVLTISTSTIFQTKNVVCDGTYTFLNDSYYEGKQEKNIKKITLSDYINKIFTNHNTQIAESGTETPTKMISKGTIDSALKLPSAKKDKFEPTSWSQSLSLLNGLTNNYGGHFKMRYVTTVSNTGSATTASYLDWYKYYARKPANMPSVVVGKNILDISSDAQIDNVFTRVIPIGNNGSKSIYIKGKRFVDKLDGETKTYTLNHLRVYNTRRYVDESSLTDEFHNATDFRNAETDYGIIYKTVDFPDANTQDKLWEEALEWIKKCYFGLVTSFTVKAIDMRIMNESNEKILLGDCCNVTYTIKRNGLTTTQTKKLVCKSVQYDLFNPENNSYTFSIPTDLLNFNRNHKSSKKKEASSAAAASSSPTSYGPGDHSWTFDSIANIIAEAIELNPDGGRQAYISFKENGEQFGTVRAFDPDEPVDETNPSVVVGPYPWKFPDRVFDARIVGKITYGSGAPRWVACNEDKGIFCYIASGNPVFVKNWYLKSKGKYEGQDVSEYPAYNTTTQYAVGDYVTYDGKIYRCRRVTSGAWDSTSWEEVTSAYSGAVNVSSFETIAQLIQNDPNTTFGGTTRANQFRQNRMSGTVNCIDLGVGSGSATQQEHFAFSAELAGKIGPVNNRMYMVASSPEYGVFAYDHTGEIPSGSNYDSNADYASTDTKNYVRHWYKRGREPSYTGSSGVFTDADGNTYATEDGNPDGDQTISIQPGEVTFSEYNSSLTYNPGAYVTHNGKTYKCRTRTTGTWNSSHWTEVTPSSGQMLVGHDLTSDVSDWKVTLNAPITYTDENGYISGVEGAVSASDFNIPSIPSFKTKLGVFDIVVANAVQAQQIAADLAELHKINSDTIHADTRISCQETWFTYCHTSETYVEKLMYKPQSMGAINLLSSIITNFRFQESNGTIKLQGVKANNAPTWSDLANFNMAATTFYTNAIAAARYAVYVHNVSIDPGQTQTFYLKYMDSSGHEQNTGRSFTVTASGGSSSGQPYNAYATRFSTPQYNDNGTLRNMTQVKNSLNTYTPIALTGSSGGDYETRSICFIGADGGHYYIAVDMP